MTLSHLGISGILTLVLGGFLVLFDFQNVLSWRKKFVLKPLDRGTDDFTVVVPLFGHPRYFANRERLEHLKDRILVAVEVSSERMRGFADQLEGEGWHVFRTVLADCSPPKLVQAVLEGDGVDTTYAMRLDADSVVGRDLPNAIAAARADGADLCSVKVLAHNRLQNLCTRLQALEYDMAMLARHYRPWLISGAGVVARTTMLREILRQHSMSPIGEDIEMGRVAFARKMRIRHLDIVIETDVPETWRALFRQRLLWWAGNFRHSIVNFDCNAVQLPWWSLYNFSIVWMTFELRPWHYAALLLHPSVILFVFAALLIVVASVVTLIANWQVRAPLMAVFPLYAIVQSSLIFSFGALSYVRLLRRSRNVGRYRFGARRRKLYVICADISKWASSGPYTFQWQCRHEVGEWADIDGETRRDLAVIEPVIAGYRVMVTDARGRRNVGAVTGDSRALYASSDGDTVPLPDKIASSEAVGQMASDSLAGAHAGEDDRDGGDDRYEELGPLPFRSPSSKRCAWPLLVPGCVVVALAIHRHRHRS